MAGRHDSNGDELGTRPAQGPTAPAVTQPVYSLPARLGRYTLIERIGVGGMAEVFVALQDGPAGFQKQVVVKRILPHLAQDPRFVEMFQREARLAASLHHTNIVEVFELDNDGDAHFIAMERVEGLTAHRLARRAWQADVSIPLEVVCGIAADAALGLQHAHERGLVHRDISPENLMINTEGVTKVLDFGVAKSTQGERTATGELKGKVPFLSPEQIRGDAIDGRADLYALGVTAYWLLTGKRPFAAPSDLGVMQAILAQTPRPPRDLNPTVPEVLDELVMCLLQKDPAQRPQSGHEVADALAPALAVRRTIVGPFVREALSGAQTNPPVEESGPANPGFLCSTPQSDEVRSSLRRLASSPRLLPTVRPSVEETSPTAPTAPTAESEPASAISIATVPVEHRVRPGRGALVAASLGGLALVAAAIAFVVLRGDGTIAAPPPAVVVAPAPVLPPPPPEPLPPPPDPTGVPVPDPVAAVPIDEPTEAPPTEARPAPSAKAREVAAAAPRWVQWQSKGGKRLGSGTAVLAVPVGTTQIVALDTQRGGRSVVDIKGGAADYGKLPRGKLQVRAAPFADVFLGSVALGQTPFAPVDLVEGSYLVVFRHEGKEQKVRVDVKGGQLARAAASFE